MSLVLKKKISNIVLGSPKMSTSNLLEYKYGKFKYKIENKKKRKFVSYLSQNDIHQSQEIHPKKIKIINIKDLLSPKRLSIDCGKNRSFCSLITTKNEGRESTSRSQEEKYYLRNIMRKRIDEQKPKLKKIKKIKLPQLSPLKYNENHTKSYIDNIIKSNIRTINETRDHLKLIEKKMLQNYDYINNYLASKQLEIN